MKRSLAALIVVTLLTLPAPLLAHEGHVHKVMGTVAAWDAKHIEVTTKEGKKETYPLNAETKYLKGKSVARAADLKAGARVVLSLVEKDGQRSVAEVLMAQPAKTGGHKHMQH